MYSRHSTYLKTNSSSFFVTVCFYWREGASVHIKHDINLDKSDNYCHYTMLGPEHKQEQTNMDNPWL